MSWKNVGRKGSQQRGSRWKSVESKFLHDLNLSACVFFGL